MIGVMTSLTSYTIGGSSSIMMSTPVLVTRMKILPSTYLAESGISIVEVKILVVTSPDVYKISMVSWATVDALVSEPEPSTSKLVSVGVAKSPLYLDGITKEVSYCTKKVRSSIPVSILLRRASMWESMDTKNS